MLLPAAFFSYRPNTPLSTGFTATTVGANNGGGTVGWTTGADGGSVVLGPGVQIAHKYRLTGLGFAIPEYAIITGIELRYTRGNLGSSTNGSYPDIYLTKAGVSVGTPNNDDAFVTPAGDNGSITWGSSSDMWGTTWTPAEINNALFGMQTSTITKNNNDGALLIPSISLVKINVHYLS